MHIAFTRNPTHIIYYIIEVYSISPYTHNPITVVCVCNLVGLGVINTSSISLVDSSFMANSPSFTLIGDTTGGPPETSTWTRNGVTISDGGSYSISLTVPGVTSSGTPFLAANSLIFQQSRYRSTLTVTGNLPGVYVYSAINRAISVPRAANFTIEGTYRYKDYSVDTGNSTE